MAGAALTPEQRSRSVFVGNIPYDATEESMSELFGRVGPVVAFRMVTDKDSGRPKGFGFCEFADPQTAESAVRNMNNFDMNGRALRVDFADDARSMSRAGPSGSHVSNPLDLIAQQLSNMSSHQMYDIMVQMKGLVVQHQEQMRQILVNTPQLAHALLQMQAMLGMLKPVGAGTLGVQTPAAPVVPAAAPVPMAMPPQAVAPGFPAQPFPPQPQPAFPMAPQPAPGFAPSVPGFAPPAAGPGVAPVMQEQLLQQVLNLTPQQIEMLPPMQRDQVRMLQQQYRR
eukprot:tig00000042_g15605.t1